MDEYKSQNLNQVDLSELSNDENSRTSSFSKRALVLMVLFFAVITISVSLLIPQLFQAILPYQSPKSVTKAWDENKEIFKTNSISFVSSHLLAAIAQIDSGSNKFSRKKWRENILSSMSGMPNKLGVSAHGIFRFDDNFYKKAKTLCVENNKVFIRQKRASKNCHQILSSRLNTSYAAGLVSGYLFFVVHRIIKKFPNIEVTQQKKQTLAAISYLCGPETAKKYVLNNFKLNVGKTCRGQNLKAYVNKIKLYQAAFERADKVLKNIKI